MPNSEQWLTLAEAADELNVHPTTLRRWANAGNIPVMVTPGGHRRFSARDIAEFKAERHSIRLAGGIERIWAEGALAVARTQMSAGKRADWMQRFDESARTRHRLLGQRLMSLIVTFVTDPDAEEDIVAQVGSIGREYARLAMRMERPLKDALEASMFFRDALIESAMQLPEKVRVRPEEKMRLLERINQLLNTVQLAVAEVYDANEKNRLSGS